MRKASRFKKLDRIPCLDECHGKDGKETFLDFVFNLFFVIRDKNEQSSEMVVSLSTFSAIKLFGVTPMDALMCEEKRAKVFQILQEICPKNEQDRHDNFLLWLIKAVAVGEGNTQFIVLTVTKGCSATTSVTASSTA